MTFDDIAAQVDPRWRTAFRRFVDTGEAEAEFLDYLDRDPEGQRAVELAFTEQASSLEGLRAALRDTASDVQDELRDTPLGASRRLANAFSAVLTLSSGQRKEAFRAAAEMMVGRADGVATGEIRSALEEFERDVVVARGSDERPRVDQQRRRASTEPGRDREEAR